MYFTEAYWDQINTSLFFIVHSFFCNIYILFLYTIFCKVYKFSANFTLFFPVILLFWVKFAILINVFLLDFCYLVYIRPCIELCLFYIEQYKVVYYFGKMKSNSNHFELGISLTCLASRILTTRRKTQSINQPILTIPF